MKTLLLLRHAKSSWKDGNIADRDRPLTARGKRDAPRMGQLIREKELVPNLIVSSTAKRARKTAELVAEHCGCDRKIELVDDVYEADVKTLIRVLAQVAPEATRVMLVGHNPGLDELLFALTGVDEHLSTAALALLTVAVAKWRDLEANTAAKLEKVWRPSELR
jgi:phosphohistidine phosphatase